MCILSLVGNLLGGPVTLLAICGDYLRTWEDARNGDQDEEHAIFIVDIDEFMKNCVGNNSQGLKNARRLENILAATTPKKGICLPVKEARLISVPSLRSLITRSPCKLVEQKAFSPDETDFSLRLDHFKMEFHIQPEKVSAVVSLSKKGILLGPLLICPKKGLIDSESLPGISSRPSQVATNPEASYPEPTLKVSQYGVLMMILLSDYIKERSSQKITRSLHAILERSSDHCKIANFPTNNQQLCHLWVENPGIYPESLSVNHWNDVDRNSPMKTTEFDYFADARPRCDCVTLHTEFTALKTMFQFIIMVMASACIFFTVIVITHQEDLLPMHLKLVHRETPVI